MQTWRCPSTGRRLYGCSIVLSHQEIEQSKSGRGVFFEFFKGGGKKKRHAKEVWHVPYNPGIPCLYVMSLSARRARTRHLGSLVSRTTINNMDPVYGPWTRLTKAHQESLTASSALQPCKEQVSKNVSDGSSKPCCATGSHSSARARV